MYGGSSDDMQMPNGMSQGQAAIQFEKYDAQKVNGTALLQFRQARVVCLQNENGSYKTNLHNWIDALLPREGAARRGKNRQALEKLEEQTTLKLCPDDDV